MTTSRLAQLLPEKLARNLRTGRELMAARRSTLDENGLPTGCEPLDHLLDGGLRRGQMVELVGGRSGGRFSMVLSALATATQRGEAAALIDLGDALCPATAHAVGIDLERLLWVRPQRTKDALMAAEAIISCSMPLVALDLGLPPIPGGRGAEAFWLRLARSAQSRRCAVLVAAPYRVTRTLAHKVVEIKGSQIHWLGRGMQPRLLEGLSNHLELTRGPSRRPVPQTSYTLHPESSVAEIHEGVEASTKPPSQTKPPRYLPLSSSPESPQSPKPSKGRPAALADDPLMGRGNRRAIA